MTDQDNQSVTISGIQSSQYDTENVRVPQYGVGLFPLRILAIFHTNKVEFSTLMINILTLDNMS